MDIKLISKLPPAESRNKIRVAHLNQENHYHSIDNSSLLYSRFKKMEEYMPFTKKAKSNKKHYPNNLHDQSHIKYLGTNALTAKLESSHDKLQIKDILGASPDSFRNQIFKNRMYGKRIDKKNIFHDPLPLPECLQEIDKDAIKGHLPKITNDLHVPQKQQIQPHSVKLNINPEVVAIRFPDEKESRTIQVPSQRRRIRTELDNHQDYYTEQRNSSIINVRRWNPTYLTDTSNPLLYKLLPKIN